MVDNGIVFRKFVSFSSPSALAVGRVLGDDDALAELGVEVDLEVPPLEQLALHRRARRVVDLEVALVLEVGRGVVVAVAPPPLVVVGRRACYGFIY